MVSSAWRSIFISGCAESWAMFESRFWCVSIVPLGRPVVPEENGSTTRSSFGFTFTCTSRASKRPWSCRKHFGSPSTNTSFTPACSAAFFAVSRNGGIVSRNLALAALSW